MDYQQWQIYWAFRKRDRDELLPIDPNNQQVNHVKGFYSDTLLHLACQNGWLDYVKLLVEKIGCDPEVKDCGHQTLLHYAYHYGHLDIVQYLIRVHNCDIAVTTGDHWTPLHYACRYGHINIIEYILDITDRKQLQHVACKCNYVDDNFRELVSLVHKQGNPENIEPILSTLLQIACSFGQIHTVQYLCSKHSSHQYLNDTEIRRLFMFCCKYGLLEVVTQLRSDVLHWTDMLGRSGLHYACQEGHIHIAKYLVEQCGYYVNTADKKGYTPLQLACQHGYNIDMVKSHAQ